ncbi:hypothetical protein STRCR_2095 [Streptococcus criceti HS-6]|uniref:Uncharacterized protein n=1 Tax=Streptococcus criceti HS-6 TaxID=873449 RepID=G5JS15_STRCG|nr:hypothetical protein STRCR_2095 [Streptococcus criceti HS-6]
MLIFKPRVLKKPSTIDLNRVNRLFTTAATVCFERPYGRFLQLMLRI